MELLPRLAYSTRDNPRLASFGIALERQTGVHAIGTDRRRDFDTWTGTMSFTPAGMDVFSESAVGGEYLVIRWNDEGTGVQRPFSRPQRVAPPAVLQLGMALRRSLVGGASPAQTEALVQRLMAALDTLHAPPPDARAMADLRQRYVRVLERIDDEIGRPDEDLSLPALSAWVQRTPLAFLRQFKQLTGMTPHAYVNERRLQRARAEIRGAEGSLAEVAAGSGYASQSHMGTAFQRALGLTPAAYRRWVCGNDARGAARHGGKLHHLSAHPIRNHPIQDL
ncbi:helix-turn-helix transcriptional regulator [Cystobacter fuscus]|nr:helix-turn-helix transcriptional regulator [Cystobacter fuscus]